MTTTTRFVPLQSRINEIASFQDRFGTIFNDFIRANGSESQRVPSTGSFVPAVDVYEDAQALSLALEVPGVKQEDIDIRLENQRLTVKGERKFEATAKQENFHRIERRFGSFVRTFTLPQTVDTDSVAASYEAGVLTIKLSKKAEAKPRQIKIEVTAGAPATKSEIKPEATTQPETAAVHTA